MCKKLNTFWYNSTYYFYLIIIAVSYAVGIFFEKFKFITFSKKNKLVNVSDILVLLILVFIKGFAYCGTDLRGGYLTDYITALNYPRFHDKSMELGHIFFNILMYHTTPNYHVVLFIYALLTLIPLFIILRKYQDLMNHAVFWATYVAIFFFQSFSLIRIYIAASMSLFVFDQIVHEKYGRAMIWILICSQIHVSSLILFVPLVFRILDLDNKKIAILLFGGTLLLILGRGSIMSSFSGRYSSYASGAGGGIGTLQFIFYVPIILLYLLHKKDFAEEQNINTHESEDNSMISMKNKLIEISYLYCMFGFSLGVLSYFIPIFGRLFVFTLPLVIFNAVIFRDYRNKGTKMYIILLLCLILYLWFRYRIYITQYHGSDGIMPYYNFFGFQI